MSNPLKIAVPSTSDEGLKAISTTRFGRCPYFTIVTLQNGEIESVSVIQNQGSNAMGGAGPVAVQSIAEEGVNAILGANYGPNAANALKQANIRMYSTLSQDNPKVKDLVTAYLNNQLEEISGATNPGHHRL
ncbi:MAG: dinitrogenase iron-molybdenum cofactor biosynthesis protein [Promethearchaeia archaeon]|nr:MAG: dinitrogenase iron-molybdenum cofactor biosynthesis protein [Candidatus Lokiarchaeia archaeon]